MTGMFENNLLMGFQSFILDSPTDLSFGITFPSENVVSSNLRSAEGSRLLSSSNVEISFGSPLTNMTFSYLYL